MTKSISPSWWCYLQVWPITFWWQKLEQKNYFTTADEIITSGQILVFEVSKQPYQYPHMIGSLASSATNSLVAKLGTKELATSCSVYRFSTNEQILMLKVSKQPYWSPPYNRITCKWCHFLPSSQKFYLKIISAVSW